MGPSKRKLAARHARQTQLAISASHTTHDENSTSSITSDDTTDEDEPPCQPPRKRRRPGELSRRNTSLDGPRLTRSHPHTNRPGETGSSLPVAGLTSALAEAQMARAELNTVQRDLEVVDGQRRAAVAHGEALSTELQTLQAVDNVHTQQLSAAQREVAGKEAECKRLRARETRLKHDKGVIRAQGANDLARAAQQHTQTMADHATTLQHAVQLQDSLRTERDALSAQLSVTTTEIARKDHTIAEARKRANKLRMAAKRAGERAKGSATTLQRIRNRASGSWLIGRRGAYSFEARELIRALEGCGCAPAQIGTILERVAKAYGGEVPRKVSRRTVGRIKMEGGLMAKVQLACEIAKARERKRGLTISDDCTSLRGVPHMARHITLEVPSYEPGADPDAYTHKTRVIDTTAMFNHTIDSQFESYEQLDDDLESLFRPIAAEIGVEYRSEDLWRIMVGKMADHAPDGQGLGRRCEERRDMVVRRDLGEAELSRLMDREVEEMIYARRPPPAEFTIGWEEVARFHLSMHLGAAAFDDLAPEERRRQELFIVGGCGGHKVMNADLAFCNAMAAAYGLGIEFIFELILPCLLPNAAHRATIETDVPGGAAARQAIAESKRGGVKLCGLLGALCNNKEDKRGYQDFHRWFFELVKFEKWGECVSRKFPDTSNIRYQSYLLAALELVKLIAEYRRFLELARDRKQEPRFTNIEYNAYTGLDDPATKTEIVSMALYYMVISGPAMRAIRNRGRRVHGVRTEPRLNYLACGPIYDEVIMHLDHIIYNAHPLFCSSGLASRGKHCVLFGSDWEDRHAIEAIEKLIPSLPGFRHTFVQGLLGARSCWDRFTVQFAGGSEIDAMTAAERIFCYMPAENDDNESLLGQLRKFARLNPTASARTFSDGASYAQNDTEAFARRYLTSDKVQQYIMHLTRKRDANGEAKKFRRMLLEHEAEKARVSREKRDVRDAAERKKREKLEALQVMLNKDVVLLDKTTKAMLTDQLNWHKVIREDKKVPAFSKCNKAELQNLLCEALDRMQFEATTSHVAAAYPGSNPLADAPSPIASFAVHSPSLQHLAQAPGFAAERLPVEYETEDEV